METTMELDDFKQAWQTLDRRLELQNTLQLQAHRERKFDSLRRKLRPLRWGQALQMIFGIVIVVGSVAFWRAYHEQPHLLVAGIIMHAYGIATIIAGGMVQGGISEIDYSAPVLDIQKQLATVRKRYVISGICVGLPWWLLWVLVLAMLVKAGTGFDMFLRAPVFIWTGFGSGVLGLLATWWFHRWSRDPSRPRLAKIMEDGLAGKSLGKAQDILDEVSQFERM